MLKSLEGVYKDGTIKLSETPSDIIKSQVIVTFLEPRQVKEQKKLCLLGDVY